MISNNFKNRVIYFVSVFSILLGGSKIVYSNSSNPIELKTEIQKAIIQKIVEIEKPRTIKFADSLLKIQPVTVTAERCDRSAGGKHDYYSEGEYWWPDTINPNGPYIRRDGINNPQNFTFHRKAIGQLSWIVSTETSAYILTGDKKYVIAAMAHLRAWFVDTATMMNPNLLYGQAIKGICTGRGIGIIDGNSLIDVAQSVSILEKSPYANSKDIIKIKKWFADFLQWLTTHNYGIDEMNAKNNHGTWWHAQAIAYANLVGNTKVIEMCKDHYINIILPKQMVDNGSFPLELERTKPFSYSLFNLEGMTSLAWSLSYGDQDYWNFNLPDGRGLKKGVDFIIPYVKDKNSWPYRKDISNWNLQPRRCQFLLFAALAQSSMEYFNVWKNNDGRLNDEESRAGLPIKNLVLWLDLPIPKN
jgi:hypothetical protein